jgi:glycosyltransferase involved in cell wall biosynthesis
MRIGYMIYNVGLGGGELLLAAHLTHADRRNFEPFVVCAGEGALSDHLRKQGVRVAFLPIDRGIKVLRFSAPRPGTALRLVAAYRREGIDLIHSYSLETRNYANAAALLTGLPLVHTCQDTWFGGSFGRLQWAAMNRISSRIVATSKTALSSLRVGEKLDPRRVSLISAGIDIKRFAPRKDSAVVRGELGVGPNVPVVALVSRFWPGKGFDVFFAAAARIAARFPAARFLVVGGAVLRSDDYAERIGELIRDLGLSQRTILTGFRDDVERLIACVDVLVSASPRESFGLTLAEAAACGRPVVATRSGGAEEIVVHGETGLLVPVGDFAALADAVISLLADPERANAMGAAGRSRAEACFDIRMMVRKIEALYSEVQGTPHPQREE